MQKEVLNIKILWYFAGGWHDLNFCVPSYLKTYDKFVNHRTQFLLFYHEWSQFRQFVLFSFLYSCTFLQMCRVQTCIRLWVNYYTDSSCNPAKKLYHQINKYKMNKTYLLIDLTMLEKMGYKSEWLIRNFWLAMQRTVKSYGKRFKISRRYAGTLTKEQRKIYARLFWCKA